MKKLYIAIFTMLLIATSCTKTPNFDVTLLYGSWASGTLHEKYLTNGSGYTWDTAEDVDESEAQSFTWELNGDQLVQYHNTENIGVVPKVYTVSTLTETTFIYKANGITYSFKKQ